MLADSQTVLTNIFENMLKDSTPPENICLSPAQATTHSLRHDPKRAALHLGHSPTKIIRRHV